MTDSDNQGIVEDVDAEISQTIEDVQEGEPEVSPEEHEETEEPETAPDPEPEGVPAEDEPDADDEVEETETPSVPVVDSRDEQIKVLQERQDQLLSLVTETLKQNKAPKPEVPAPVLDEVSEDAVRMALFGGPDDQWKRLTEKDRAAALKIQADYVNREVQAARDPRARYSQMKDLILRDVAQMFEPLAQDFHNRRAKEIVERHLSPIKDPEVRKRAEALFRETPGAQSASWDVQDKSLGIAAKLALAEARDKKLAEKSQKEKATKLQANAAAPKLKARGNPPGANKGKPAPDADLRDGESLLDYMNRVK